MEVSFTPDTEMQLQEVAATLGKTPAQFVEDTVGNALDRRAQFLAAVDRGIAAADQGDFIEHDEAVLRISSLFKS